MTEPDPLERQLLSHRDTLARAGAIDAHLSDERIARAADGTEALDTEALAHLSRCAECREIWAVVAGEAREAEEVEVDTGGAEIVRLQRRRWIGLAAAAVIAIALVPIVRNQWSGDDYRSRGGGSPFDAVPSVTLLATDAHGVVRELVPGAHVRLDERLGFRYGNAQGRHSTLAIVGWDGTEMHWYYPDAPSDRGEPIKTGISERLPFDIALAEKHRAGPLKIAASFDIAPRELADIVQRGGLAFEIVLEEAPQ